MTVQRSVLPAESVQPARALSQQPVDRRAVVSRHDIRLEAPDPALPITVGNGDFGFTADITGMQTFTAFHDPTEIVGSDLTEVERGRGRNVVNTATMSTWGWHEMPAPHDYSLADAMTEYVTHRGVVRYPDKTDHDALLSGRPAADPSREAGNWLHANPHRLDLGRIGMQLHSTTGAAAETDPHVLRNTVQTLELWSGKLKSQFSYQGHSVRVSTTSDPEHARVAFRIEGSLLTSGLATIELRFPYASDHFMATSDWGAEDKHQSALLWSDDESAVVARTVDSTRYVVRLTWTSAVLTPHAPHAFSLQPTRDQLDLTVEFAPTIDELPERSSALEVEQAASDAWEDFWSSGAAIDLGKSTDPRAHEIERRIVLSQYLTQVNSSGVHPPQETGLVTNSWQGKFHLEMHWWHAMHFAAWGRPDRLERSLQWYLDVLDSARETAVQQGYAGARWPKQVGPDGRESPSDIGSLIIWQQPHLLYMIEMLTRANPSRAAEIISRFAAAIDDTAAFMADFVEERDGVFHLPAPLMPAQEFYDARTTEDPTFELAYWWWALEAAQRFRAVIGLPRVPRWQHVLDHLSRPRRLADTGTYAAIGSPPYLRRDDHPAMLLAYGFVPTTPLIDRHVMAETLDDAWHHWDWDSAWGWDYPAMAMTATRLDRPDLAVEALLLDAPKNTYVATGHNRQMPSFLPIYLPGNGGLLAAVALMAGGWDGSEATPGFPLDQGWMVQHEGFVPWPR